MDAGLSAQQTKQRLAEIGERPEDIDAICISHEHTDHVAGIRVLQNKYGIPVYANAETRTGIIHSDQKCAALQFHVFSTGAPFKIGDVQIEPFSVPHDARDPVGFVVSAGERSIGVATDMGVVTNLIREKLRRCHVAVIEANHDEELLYDSPRPWGLKQRIRGNQGHLSNIAAATLVAEIAGDALQHLFLAHMSVDCNCPHRARSLFESLLAEAGHTHVTVRLTCADRVSEQLIL